jgi:hypothetical protein
MRPGLALGPWWTRDPGMALPLWGSGGCHDTSEREGERERSSSRFSPITSLGGGDAEMVTRRCSTKAEGSGWHLEVEDNQRKLVWCAKCAVVPNCGLSRRKKYDREYEMDQKDRRRNIDGPKGK